jgi:integrase
MRGKLSDRKVQTAKTGKYADGGNLYLIVSETGARKWVFRFQWQGRAKERGLGSASDVPLAEARVRASDARLMLAKGINPIEAAKRDSGVPTFGAMADEVCEALASGFRNEKHRSQWKSTLQTHAAPLRGLPVDGIDTSHLLAVLKPIWQAKAETASRLRGRIEKVLDAAKAKGFREGENPARWRGHLDHLLPARSKLSRGHHAALPYSDLPGFMADLRNRNGMAALALEFLILTAARSGEVKGARWPEINLETKVWNLPGERMKAGRPHSVPLSSRAIEILETAAEARSSEYIFSGQRHEQPLSSMAFDMLLRRMGRDVTTHGFRSTFRDWAGNETSFPRELAEHALAHIVGDKAEQAYRRSTALERRRELMEAWTRYCGPRSDSTVVAIGRPAA